MRDSPESIDDTMRWTEATESRAAASDALSLTPIPPHSSDGDEADDTSDQASAPWRSELLRWLATLNPGRTQTEYAKAVRYFFETPGVPQFLEDLTFDLLLAYRGALAHRATAHERGENARTAHRASGQKRVEGPTSARLAGGQGATPAEAAETGTADAGRQGILSPATVNLRLTALRQFLVHCSLLGSLPQLTPDRIRAALRRMSIERRRPYQVLAEQEWAGFLEAARLPATLALARSSEAEPGKTADGAPAADQKAQGPWGTPRAVRRAAEAETEAASAPNGDTSGTVGTMGDAATTLPRSHAGLTGRYTAQRDFALVSLALATGLRAIELAELDLGDLVREWQGGNEEWWLVLPDAKTKGQHGGRTLPLAPTLVETLLTYVTSTGRRWEREADRNTPLFLAGRRQRVAEQAIRGGARAGRLSPQQIRAIVDRVETQWVAQREANTLTSGVGTAGETRRISPHALRHSTAIALLSGNDDAGRPPASVEHVRGWLGHFDIRTTQGYLAHLDARRHRRPYTLSLGESRPVDHPADHPEDASSQQT